MGILDRMALAGVGFCGAAVRLGECNLGRAGGIEVMVVGLGSGGAQVDLGGAGMDLGGAEVDLGGPEVASHAIRVDSLD